MSKKEAFIDYVTEIMDELAAPEMSEEAQEYWDALRFKEEKEKPMFTDNGKLIMEYLKSLPDDVSAMKSKDIAEALVVSSRTISGSMRKLVSDGFVEKIGDSPVLYKITEKGKNIEIN